jgi:hypothetical protein
MSPAKWEENEDELDESGAANIQEVRKDLYEESEL